MRASDIFFFCLLFTGIGATGSLAIKDCIQPAQWVDTSVRRDNCVVQDRVYPAEHRLVCGGK